MNIRIACLIILLSFANAALGHNKLSQERQASSALPLAQMLKSSDSLFNRFNDKGAREYLLEADKIYPRSAEVLWRLARAETHIADHMPISNDEQKDAQLKTYEIAYNFADSAVSADPKRLHGIYISCGSQRKDRAFQGRL